MIEYTKRNMRSWSIMGINPAIWSIGFASITESIGDFAVFTADLARYSGLERTFNNYPNNCFNVGIAEQNMVSIAAGMAMQGTQTYMTTYAPFMSLRCADQVRHLMGNLNLNMKAIGSAAGLSAGLSGSSLLAINDISFTRSIPNMVVLSPADCTEAVKMIEAMSKNASPTYMRFCGAVRIPCVYEEDYLFEIGKAIKLREGRKIALVATGTDLVYNAVKVADKVKEEYGIAISVYNVHTIKPIDEECIKEIAKTHNTVITIEEHSIIGGLGSAVAEVLTTSEEKPRQIFLGIQDKNYKMGSRPFMLEQAGLSIDKIYELITKII